MTSPVQSPPSHGSESQYSRASVTFIHILDDDSLLNIFRLYRPALWDKDEDDDYVILRGGHWSRERWWYKLVHVCRRWRYLILGSAPYLDLCLVCTRGTPVAKMLLHSPSLPIVIDYLDANCPTTEEDDVGIMLVLEQHRDRVRRIGIGTRVLLVLTVITALRADFPILEYLVLMPREMECQGLRLPKTFQAPRLQHLMMSELMLTRRSPSLVRTAKGLVTLYLTAIHTSTCISPHLILRLLLHMPQLQTLKIDLPLPFMGTLSGLEIEFQLLQRPIRTHVTLPNLRWFEFHGDRAFLEALLAHFTAPRLEKLDITFFESDLPTFSVPQLIQFTTKSFKRSRRADLVFLDDDVTLTLYPQASGTSQTYALRLSLPYLFFDQPVASVAQTSNALSPLLLSAKKLNLCTDGSGLPLDWDNNFDEPHWRDVLRPFKKVKYLFVDSELVDRIARSLCDEIETPLEVLPEMSNLVCWDREDAFANFERFLDARNNTSHPVTLIVP
ncbi:hypothetical protein BC827DRAFT_1271476 [Russula dissimulans]|nr:hypothetical protein BC827DRAFT_1271476 [Russula dissimulans]